jgi:hypothetical protein
VGEVHNDTEAAQYRHFMFGWERRWAASGARRLEARGDPRGFLNQGPEAYGYLACAFIWGSVAAIIAILVFFPTLIVGRGMTIAGGVELAVVYLLLAMTFLRAIQSKRARRTPAT